MNKQVVEQYWAVFRRHLPLLKFLDKKKYGLVIVQLHAGKPVKVGYVPGLEALGEAGFSATESRAKRGSYDHGSNIISAGPSD